MICRTQSQKQSTTVIALAGNVTTLDIFSLLYNIYTCSHAKSQLREQTYSY